MACNLKRFIDMPIPDEFKEPIVRFLQDPKNAQACEVLSGAPDEVIMEYIQDLQNKMQQQPKPGPQGPAPRESGMQMASLNQPPGAQNAPGAGKPPPTRMSTAGVPLNQMSSVTSPMETQAQPPRGYARGGIATIQRRGDNRPVQRYGLGGFVKRLGSKLGLGDDGGGLVGGILGAALSAYTGGMSMAWGASLGSAAGNYLQTGDIGQAMQVGMAGGMYGAGAQAMAPGLSGSASTEMYSPPGASDGGRNRGRAPEGYRPRVENPTPTGVPALPKPAPVTPKANDFMSSPWMKYGTGIAMLAGSQEQPKMKEAPVALSAVDKYYAAVQKAVSQGQDPGSVPRPPELAQTPASHQFFNRQPTGYAKGGAVDNIPALLTEGEFVMTKQAVDNAGGSDKMYDLMDDLENRYG